MTSGHCTSLLYGLFSRSSGEECRISSVSGRRSRFQLSDEPPPEKRPSRIAYNGRSQSDPWFDTPGFSHHTTSINLGRRPISQRLMRPVRVVEPKISPQSLTGDISIVVVSNVDLLVLQAAPQPLDKDIVQEPTPSVHTYLYSSFPQPPRKIPAGKLRPLIGVENPGLPPVQCSLQSAETESGLQRIRQFPLQNVSAEPIHNRYQIQGSSPHRDIGDIGTPYFVWCPDLHISQQVRKNPMFRMWSAGMWSGHHSLYTHQPHQAGHSFLVYQPSQFPQPYCHPRRTVKRSLQIQLINHAHKPEVFLTFSLGRPQVITRSSQPRQLTLPYNRQPGRPRIDPGLFHLIRCGQSFFLNQSTSIWRRPICSYRGAVITSSVLPFPPPPRLNTSGAPCNNVFFHREITVGCTLKRELSSLSVLTSFIASRATLALNSSECFCRFFDIVISSILWTAIIPKS